MSFAPYLECWNLVPDGPSFCTAASALLPVKVGGVRALLKVALNRKEARDVRVMALWRSEALAPVLAHDGQALLLERSTGGLEGSTGANLCEMARSGYDDEATRVLCRVTTKLHKDRGPPDELIDLSEWFIDLSNASVLHNSTLSAAKAKAEMLLSSQREIVDLHGDIHHGNVLYFRTRDWRAIDPKGLRGERTFDFVNILRNPDAGIALRPGRFQRQARVIADEAGLDFRRLCEWTLAFCGLSAVWHMIDAQSPALDLTIAELAMTVAPRA